MKHPLKDSYHWPEVAGVHGNTLVFRKRNRPFIRTMYNGSGRMDLSLNGNVGSYYFCGRTGKLYSKEAVKSNPNLLTQSELQDFFKAFRIKTTGRSLTPAQRNACVCALL